jgi:hypothetical protein
MKLRITDEEMKKKMSRALESGGNMYDLDDICAALESGDMQGHVEGDTWIITQVHYWGKKLAVNIIFVVGDMDDALKAEPKIEAWAKELGAKFITGIGRDGWWGNKSDGWEKMGNLYRKDIK